MDKILPQNIAKKDLFRFDEKIARNIPQHEIKKINDVFFNSDNIIFKGGKILPMSFVNGTLEYYFNSPKNILTVLNNYVGLKKFFSDPFLLVSRWQKKKIIMADPCLCFTDTWSIGYFHWFLDALPRLVTAEKYINRAIIILPAEYKKKDYVVSSLKIFGVEKIRWVENNEVLFIKNLIIPNQIAPSGNYDSKITQELIKKIKNYYAGNRQISFGDKIYISRSKAKRRKIKNENEILPILSKFGFKKICLEDYKWEDQISICQNAKYLIGNHGAGLTNLIFMDEGSKVLELGGKKNPFYLYFSLAQKTNIEYYYQICEYFPSLFKKTNNKKDLVVNPQILEKNIGLMLT